MTTAISPSLSNQECQVIHQVAGRTRFRLPLLAKHPQLATEIQPLLEKHSGITSVRINRVAACMVVQYVPNQLAAVDLSNLVINAVKDLTNQEFYDKPNFRVNNEPETPEESGYLEETESSLRLPIIATALAVLSRFPQLTRLRSVARIAFILAAFPVAKRAFNSLINQRRLNIDCLDFLALSLSATQGKLVTPAMVILLHELGDVIREKTARATEVRTASLMDAIGRFAWVVVDDLPPKQIPSDRLQVGDKVVVYPGEQIPVDGTVLKGEAVIDEQGLTGEAMPLVKRVGESVLASTLVRSGQLYLQADRVGSQTRAALSIELLQKAPVYDTRMANYAEKVADRLIWPSLLLAGIVLVTSRDSARAAAILTLDFVTGIRVSIPTAFWGALNHTTRHGILVRSGRTLEQLAEVDTVVFDKTGTLTEGEIAIAAVRTIPGGMSETELLKLAAAAEMRLNHPVAEAIVNYAAQLDITIPPRGEWFYDLGLGVRAEIESHQVLVGSQRFLEQQGVNWGDNSLIAQMTTTQMTQIYVACDGNFQGVIEYTDPLKPESDRLLQALQQNYGIQVHLLTGDNPQRAAFVAEQLGIPKSRVYAEAFPDEKARIVRDLHRAGRTVAFVGDGLNDSVALAYADVSISFEHGSDIARETADVVLMNNNLLDVLEAIDIARQTRNLIDQNIALVVAPNLAALGLASTVGLNPLVATAIHNGSAIAAGMNSLRPLVEHQMDNG
ncbi:MULTISPECIES: heavy metal translocating P-type ATPase [Limnospira]|uniref:heavy metal translocating P-type ATPase n=1 Tax=Limnospira TaxID=2596745 RepID=UPI0001D0E76D|nr:heavy metal translocating P-type ATPase [Arthrospira platensis NCB002]MDT9181889.1 heavy metal translocating P-type ATPase [Limnospira sp. PMC 289.06]BAI91353.1 cation-transporting P-type ATPase [Arthrospira platensis NIES-39]BDT13668.1 cation-transporting P-type ATPase [Arthrospira platensis NIES-39]